MPGRVARAPRTTTTTTKTSSTPTPTIPNEGPPTPLRREICAILSDAQRSTTGHRKLVVRLRKVHEACCYEPVSAKAGKRAGADFEEDDFNAEIVRAVLRVLGVRKSEPVGDRVVRFLGTFLATAAAKDNEIAAAAAQAEEEDASGLPETPISRLTARVLRTLLPLLGAKDRVVKFRATQVISHMINSLDTLDDGLFHQLRTALLRRIHDKEAMVRLQAVYGLGRLAAEAGDEDKDDSDSDSDRDSGAGVLQKLLHVLQNDPAAEVRRNLLLNLPLTKEVLPYLLERARDADAPTRRALYARLLPALGDFRHLSLTHREKLLRWGLRDRDENVRKATARLFRERWIEDCAALPAAQAAAQAEAEGGEPQAQKPANQAADPSLDALLELLERIDVVNSGTEGGIALTAMKDFWEGRPDYVDYVSFPDGFWDDLTPELAFVARTFNGFCRSELGEEVRAQHRNLAAMVEEKMPEVTKFGFFLERELNRLVECIRLAASGEDEDAEEDAAQREFVVEQLLHMACTLDYSDEVGRRKMFGLMREALATADLPEESTKLVVEVLRLVCGGNMKGEREFCGIVLEAIAEVHDTIMGEDEGQDESSSSVEESFHSANSNVDSEGGVPTAGKAKKKKQAPPQTEEDAEAEEETAVREIMVNMKCLHIALCMLQNVAGELEDNVHLVTMLNNLVVPAVRSQEAPIRERGLLCLGLCCLLGENLASENLTLFLHCHAKGHPALQTIALQILTDILLTHPTLLPPASDLHRPLQKTYLKSLRSSNPTLASTAATALSKLLLTNSHLTHPDLLKALLTSFFAPETASNPLLRQALAYFLPTYTHLSATNAFATADLAPAVIAKLAARREELLDDADAAGSDDNADPAAAMVKLTTVASLLADWTDPRKILATPENTSSAAAFAPSGGAAEGERPPVPAESHYHLASTLLTHLLTTQTSKDERKVLITLLGKCHFPGAGEGVGAGAVTALLELVQRVSEEGVVSDAVGRNALARVREGLLRVFREVGGREGEETVLGGEGEGRTVVLEDRTVAKEGAEVEGEASEGTAEEITLVRRGVGETTIGAPDAEGTRLTLGRAGADGGMEDSEMGGTENYTTTEV